MIYYSGDDNEEKRLRSHAALTRYTTETEVEFWSATDYGARVVRLSPQTSVPVILVFQREQVVLLLKGERDIDLRPLDLHDFHYRPVFGLYGHSHRQ